MSNDWTLDWTPIQSYSYCSDFLNECLLYDFATNVWLPDAFMNEARFSAESFFVGDQLMVWTLPNIQDNTTFFHFAKF